MSRSMSLLIGLFVFSVVCSYLVLGLPRLSTQRAVLATGAMSLLLIGLVALTTPFAVTSPLMGLAALVAGHGGWWLGRRPPRDRRRRARSGERAGRRPERRRSSAIYRDTPSSAAAPAARSVAKPGPAAVAVPAAAPELSSAPPPISPSLSAAPEATSTQPIATSGLPMADLKRTRLGRYRIDRAIGRGSMGAVFLGLDPVLGRQVAIKTLALSQEFDGAELVEAKQRFFREAETAGRLQHRDIVTIYDAGEDEDLAYIAMEFLKGHDLQRHTVASQLLPVPVVLRIGARVADALAYAHSQGVVHRDVKPANVMLHQPTGAVKVTDFGIARITDASRTRTGMVLGTPSFMSPEHLSGQRVDGRTDLYSLGVMLFQLLTAELPFQAESMAKLMYKIANDEAADVRTRRPDLPAELAAVVARAVAKSPGARYADGAAMADELRAIDAAGQGGLWSGSGSAADATAPAEEATRPYDATVRFARSDSGHNSPS